MPELPEVETICRQLKKTVVGKKIVSVDVLYPKVVRPFSSRSFSRGVIDATIRRVSRRAKLILLELSNGKTMIVHLKLTGRLLFFGRGGATPLSRSSNRGKGAAAPRDIGKSTELIFNLNDGSMLRYDDLRRFGYIRYLSTKDLEHYFAKEGYGPEPFDRSFTPGRFKMMLQKKAVKKIKPLLMDQTFLAGVGNIYAQEACFCGGISPMRRAGKLTGAEIRKLYTCLRSVMTAAVKAHGSSSNDYLDLYGHEGAFVPKLKVYGREGEPCRRCRCRLKKMILAGRGTVFCSNCQV